MIYKGNDNYYLMATSTNGGVPGGRRRSSAAAYADAFGASVLAANTWTHLAATYDGATLRLYVNGALVASQADDRAHHDARRTRCRSAATASSASTSTA